MNQRVRIFKPVLLLEKLLVPVAAITAALIFGAVIIGFMGCSPFLAYESLLSGALGSKNAVGETLIKAAPLIFSALSYAIARRSGMINLGAEGQIFIGALCATFVGTNFSGIPAFLHILLVLGAGFLGGAVFGGLAAFMKTKFNANELITTMMLNFIAYAIVSYFVGGPIKDTESVNNIPQSPLILESASLHRIWPGTRLHSGVILAVSALLFYFVFLWKTTKGYEMRVIGLNRSAGEYAGMNLKSNAYLSMLLAGGMAGLAGCVEIIGVQMRLTADFAVNMGFDGIAVALVGANSPIGIAFSSLFFGMLKSGSNKMQMAASVPSAVIYMIQGLVILFVAGRKIFARRKNA